MSLLKNLKPLPELRKEDMPIRDLNTSDLGYFCGRKAIEDAGIDQEELDYIIVAHNFGDV